MRLDQLGAVLLWHGNIITPYQVPVYLLRHGSTWQHSSSWGMPGKAATMCCHAAIHNDRSVLLCSNRWIGNYHWVWCFQVLVWLFWMLAQDRVKAPESKHSRSTPGAYTIYIFTTIILYIQQYTSIFWITLLTIRTLILLSAFIYCRYALLSRSNMVW